MSSMADMYTPPPSSSCLKVPREFKLRTGFELTNVALLTGSVYFCEVSAQRSGDKEVTSNVLLKHEKLRLVL